MSKSIVPQSLGLAIDWETSGYSLPNYAEKHSGISFGAAIFDISNFNIVDSIYCEVKPKPNAIWSPEAEKIHGLTREHLEANGLERTQAAAELAGLVLKWIGTGKIIALGHRVHFDINFTDDLMRELDIAFEWDPIKFDSAAFGAALFGETASDKLFELCGLPARGEHNSLEDIVFTVEAVRYMKEAFKRGVA